MMKTRILALILLMALIFPVMATNPTTTEPPKPLLPLLCQMLGLSDILEALNLCPGSSQQCPCNKKTPNDPKCINMQIPFGRPVNRPEIPSGTILLQAEKPTASLFTPQSLAFDFEFNSYIVDAPSTHDKGQGNTSYTYVDVTVARPNGQGITYRFNLDALTANDRYSGLPIGKDVAMNSKMRYIAPETNHPAYYERLSPTGYKARFPADNYLMAKPTIITPQGQELTWNSQDVQVEPIYRDNALRQIWSAADGLADFVVIDDYKYEIRLYAPENAGSKNGQGLYVPQNSPVELWTVENPNRSDTNFNNVRISQTIAGTTYVYDWTYTEGTDAWTVTSGAGLRTASKHYFGDFKTTDCQIIEETRDAANNVVSKKVSNSHKFDWGPAIVDETLDPDGANLKTSYTYYMTSSETGRYGRMKTLLKPDGSWESYDYDSTGRPTLVVSSYLDAAFDSAANSAKAVYYSYTSLDTADELLENDGRARTVETKILGITVNKKYFVYKTVNGEAIEIKEEGIAAFGDSTNQRKTTVYYAGTSRIKSITWTDGKLDSYSYEYGTYSANPDPASCSFTAGTGDALRQIVIHGTSANPAGVAGKSTKETKVTDGRNNNVMTETYAYDGAGYSRVAWNVDTFDAQHHVLASYNSDGTYSTATWNCCSKDSETTSDGTQYNYSYNLLKQMVSKTKVDGPSTAYICDAEDRLLSVTVSGGGTSLSSFAIHDLAGRVTSTTDVAGLVTTYAYSNGDRTISITHPGGFTESKDLYLDGRIKSLVGTALVPKYYTYGVNQDGTLWTKIYTASENGPNYVKTTVDALGRTVSEERPGYNGAIATNYFYNSQGLLVKKTSTNQVDTLYAYDGFNNQIQTVLDLNANGQIDLASDDRISESETSYQSDSGQWWSVATSKVYGDNGSVTTGTTKNRLTGLGNGLISETHSIDINGNDTVSTTTLGLTIFLHLGHML